jgi:hypothetical protein
MKTLKDYTNFINENVDINLLEQPFITKDEKTGEYLIVAVKYFDFPNSLIKLNKRTFTELKYQTLMRYLLFGWLYKYNGTNETLLEIKNQFTNKNMSDEFTRLFTQIPTNFTIMNKFVRPLIGNCSIDSKDYNILNILFNKRNIIFTEKNVIEWYSIVNALTNRSNLSEQKTVDFIKKQGIYKDAYLATGKEDKSGIDIWLVNDKGEKIPAQVKEPSKDAQINLHWGKPYTTKNGKTIKDYFIVIEDTSLELKDYYKFEDGNLIWKFLFLWDNKNNLLYQINSSAIVRIKKDIEKNHIFIVLNLDETWLPRMVKTYNVKK